MFYKKAQHVRELARARQRKISKRLIVKKTKREVGRRIVKWTFFRGVAGSMVSGMMAELEKQMRTSFYIRHSYSYQLRNVETGKLIEYHKNSRGSTWLRSLEEPTRAWLTAREEQRLAVDNVDRPNTKWAFAQFKSVETKAIIDRQPLLGKGHLPEWLRQKKGLYALDTYGDNLCLFRCLALHNGARRDRCTARARQLATEFYGAEEELKDVPTTSLDLAQLKKVEGHFKLGIRVYEPAESGDWHLTRQPARYDKLGTAPMTIGVYDQHAFLIKDISTLASVYVCGHCQQRFTQAFNLQRHANACTKGDTIIVCPGERVLSPQSAYEKAFYPKGNIGVSAIRWLEAESRQRDVHIHHHLCGHGGERWIEGAPVDGYDPVNKTVYQFHGCHWHGCSRCFSTETQRKQKVHNSGTREKNYERTLEREAQIREAGYDLVVRWEHERPRPWKKDPLPTSKTVTYPHAIVYDFEAFLNRKTTARSPSDNLLYENEHTPISVSIGDTLDTKTEHICNRDSKELIDEFVNALERRAAVIRADVRRRFLPEDVHLLAKKYQRAIAEWCDQVPVVGFNSGKYDLNLIKKHFVERLTNGGEHVKVGRKANRTIFLVNSNYRFLDIMNYLAPGTSYDKWVKAYGCTAQTKSWFPYEWFDSPDKLDYPSLPDYPAWYSRQTGAYLLTLREWHECKRTFDERGMHTFSDWLRYYNNLDVAPFVEALVKMRDFYTARGVDIFKDAVSLPGVSLQYLLRGTLSSGSGGVNAPILHAPSREAYDMLKASVIGGPSIVFTRYHEAGVTKIRSHQYDDDDARLCKRILGYDANALYLSTMKKEMPCGKESVTHFESPAEAVSEFTKRLMCSEWFGFAEVDIEVPRSLWRQFEEMPPLFYNKEVPETAVPPHMLAYLEKTGRTRQFNQKKLLGALSAEKILLYAPLLKWYVEHGLVITAVYRSIDYRPQTIFGWFVDEVTDARRMGDEDKEKAIFAEVFKLLGNSCYGKFIEALERQTKTSYSTDEKAVDRILRSAFFDDLNEIGAAYEFSIRVPRVVIDRPFQIGIAVYQLAKLRILEFYYDFLDRFVDRRDYELIQMDTDSLYFALSGNSLDDVGLGDQEACRRKEWLAWDEWSNRTPGLFKLEFEGHRAIALCSKCYIVDGETDTKHSAKGISARHNDLTWGRYKAALHGNVDTAENRGFRMVNGTVHTYRQYKLGLSAYYDKRRVLPDGVHTEPLEYTSVPVVAYDL